MKVRVVLTLEVEPEEWCEMYGVATHAEVRDDVRTYVLAAVQGSAPAVDQVISNVRLV